MTIEAAPRFSLGTFSDGGAPPFPGLVVGDRVIDLREGWGPRATTLELLEEWPRSFERLESIAVGPDRTGVAFDKLRVHAPVEPRQILCAGANYRRHVRELAYEFMRRDGDERPEEDVRAAAAEQALELGKAEPYMFAGLPSALSGANDDIVLWGPGSNHDWELELAIVIGRGGREIPTDKAMDHIAGYTLCNDVTTRDLLSRPGFPMSDIVMAKNRPTFFPTGPVIVPRSEVPDPRQIRLTLRLNGDVMQDETLDDLIHPIDRLVSYASYATRLFPGDLLLTGSPAGNAAHHGNRWLRAGDIVEGEITLLGRELFGRQRNRCVAAPE